MNFNLVFIERKKGVAAMPWLSLSLCSRTLLPSEEIRPSPKETSIECPECLSKVPGPMGMGHLIRLKRIYNF
jgi:hypothetical protein